MALAGLAASTLAFAGGDSSSGGGAMVCRYPDGSIKAELLDLWEVQFREDGAQVVRTDEDVEVQLEKAIQRVKAGYGPNAAAELRERIAYVRSKARPVKLNVEISPPVDALNDLFEKGCKLEGAALYNDRKNVLHINPEVLNAMPKTDQAALWVHEAVYHVRRNSPVILKKMFGLGMQSLIQARPRDTSSAYEYVSLFAYRDQRIRENPDQNSILTREFVGQLFSTKAIEAPKVKGESFIHCKGEIRGTVFVETGTGYQRFEYVTSGDTGSESGHALNQMIPIAQYGTVTEEASNELRLVDRPLSDKEWMEVVGAYGEDLTRTVVLQSNTCNQLLRAPDIFMPGLRSDDLDHSRAFIVSPAGSSQASGLLMTVFLDQTLHASYKTDRSSQALVNYRERMFRGKVFQRNLNVQPLCKRYYTSETPLPWATN